MGNKAHDLIKEGKTVIFAFEEAIGAYDHCTKPFHKRNTISGIQHQSQGPFNSDSTPKKKRKKERKKEKKRKGKRRKNCSCMNYSADISDISDLKTKVKCTNFSIFL